MGLTCRFVVDKKTGLAISIEMRIDMLFVCAEIHVREEDCSAVGVGMGHTLLWTHTT